MQQQEKVFPNPTQLFYGTFSPPQQKAMNYVREQLHAGNWEFNPPYDVKQLFDLIGKLLRESGWNLEQVEKGWKVSPLI